MFSPEICTKNMGLKNDNDFVENNSKKVIGIPKSVDNQLHLESPKSV